MFMIIGCGKCGKVFGLLFGHFILHIRGRFIHKIIHVKYFIEKCVYLLYFQVFYFYKVLIMW